MTRKIKTVLCGVGGYGDTYTGAYLDGRYPFLYLVAGVDPVPCPGSHYDSLKKSGVSFHTSLEDFYRNGHADLAILCSPIQHHCAQAVTALRHGSHVLCEKPLCAVIQDAYRMIEVRQEAGKHVAIGYQWSFSLEIQRLKADILSGVYGKPLLFKTQVLWSRPAEYYLRNTWAGKRQDTQGNWVIDSPANNATAHYLHNMFYLLGGDVDTCAMPVSVCAELYRAHDIDNYDTAMIRCHVDTGARVLFYGTHATLVHRHPDFVCECERGRIELTAGPEGTRMKGTLSDGTVRDYGAPPQDNYQKVFQTAQAILENSRIVCGIEAAMGHTVCVNGAQESGEPVVAVPEEFIGCETRTTPAGGGNSSARHVFIKGIDECINSCFEKNLLPHELGIPWARAPKEITLKNYRFYPSEKQCPS